MVRILLASVTSIFVTGCLAGIDAPNLSANPPPALSTDANVADASSDAGPPQDSKRDPATSSVSRSNVEKSCRSGSAAFIGDRYGDCVKQEMEAKQQLAQSKVYTVADRQACASEDSYVEQLTCLQVKDWLRHPDETVDLKRTAATKADQPKLPASSGAAQP
jgi:hypothetical protein